MRRLSKKKSAAPGGEAKAMDKPLRVAPRWVMPYWVRPARKVAGVVAAFAIMVGVPLVAVKTGSAAKAGQEMARAFHEITGDAGLTVQEVTIAGRGHSRPDAVLAAVGVKRGDALLALDLTEARKRILALPWIKEASIERRLNGVVHLRVTEREAIALWQHGGQTVMVDKDGTPIVDDISDFTHLPVVVGENAPSHAAELVAMLKTEPAMMTRVKAAVRVSERRWNLKLDDLQAGIEVSLPEQNAEAAYKRLVAMEREMRLLDRKLVAVDLRAPDRMYLRTTADAMPRPPIKGKGPGKDA